ncbi:MAG: dCTP deaminase [bacterium]
MPIKADSWITASAKKKKIIEPFNEGLNNKGVISYGVSSYGYDFRLGFKFKEPVDEKSKAVDPKDMAAFKFKSFESKEPFYIKENSIIIAQSLEFFRIPKKVLGICFGKSTYSRCGLLVNITPLEPEWEGIITFPLINNSSHPIKVYPGEGIAQVIFIESDTVCSTSYADRKGKYQSQKEITLSKV